MLIPVPFVLALMAVDQLSVFSWATHDYVVGLYQPVQDGQDKGPRTVSIPAVRLNLEAAAEQSTRLGKRLVLKYYCVDSCLGRSSRDDACHAA